MHTENNMRHPRHVVKLNEWLAVINDIKFMEENNGLVSLNITYEAFYLAGQEDACDMDGMHYTASIKHYLADSDLSLYTNRSFTALISAIVKQYLDLQHTYYQYVADTY